MPVSVPALFRLVIFLCLLFPAGVLFSQPVDSERAQLLKAYKQADVFYQKAIRVSSSSAVDETTEDKLNKLALDQLTSVYQRLSTVTPSFDSLLFFAAYKIGEIHHYFLQEKEALPFYRTAVMASRKANLPDSVLFKPFLYQGIILYNQSKLDSALRFFKAAEQVQLRYSRPLEENQRLYNTLGALYYAIGDYSSAKRYFQKALDVLTKAHPSYRELFVNYNINLASTHVMLEEYDEANAIYQRLLPYRTNQNEIYHNLGLVNLNLGAFHQALSFFSKVVYPGNRQIRLYNDIGYTYLQLKRYDSARAFLEKARVENGRLNNSEPNLAFGLTLHNLGKLCLALHRVDAALDYFQQAIHQFYPAFHQNVLTANPQQFSGVFSYINLFNVLVDKAAALDVQFTKTGNIGLLKQELETFESAFRLVDYVEKTYNSDEARLFLGKSKYQIHEKPIDVAVALYRKTGEKKFLQTAYIIDQKTKASVLAYNLQLAEANRGSPLLNEERRLKTEITRLSLKARQPANTKQLQDLTASIRSQEITLGKLQEKLNQENPASDVHIPDIYELQRHFLDGNTAILSFHLSDSAVTIFTITSQSAACLQKRLYPGFRQELKELISYFRNGLDWKDAEKSNRKLAGFLVGNMRQEHLLIIPDDELTALPFEALIDGDGAYLVQKHTIQYQYSTALLRKEKKDFSGASVLALAPFAKSAYNAGDLFFAQLKNSANEIDGSASTVYTDTAATKQAFLAHLQHADILHLATHAAIDKNDNSLSFVAFSPAGATNADDYLLYAREIANIPLTQARLVILSACETGSGELVKGEGVMSLSRAFAYAGCPNTVASLWKADDAATSYLISRMYRYLDKGLSIADAIRNAKRDYLSDNRINPRFKRPAYWAHLVFVGNYQPETSRWWLLSGVAAVVMLLLLLYLYWHLQKMKRTIQ